MANEWGRGEGGWIVTISWSCRLGRLFFILHSVEADKQFYPRIVHSGRIYRTHGLTRSTCQLSMCSGRAWNLLFQQRTTTGSLLLPPDTHNNNNESRRRKMEEEQQHNGRMGQLSAAAAIILYVFSAGMLSCVCLCVCAGFKSNNGIRTPWPTTPQKTSRMRERNKQTWLKLH